ncbi:MAG: hypothetical protein VX498_05970, partial [Myxococcota bacterium]|nr:hypothetical protein [Myxococcota bacterium]
GTMSVTIPLRGSRTALTFTWELDVLVGQFDDLNRTLEELSASVLTVLVERWPDWPVEVWGCLGEVSEGSKPRWDLDVRFSIAGLGPEDKHVAAVARFLIEGVSKLIPIEARMSWEKIDLSCRPLWIIDDGLVHRVLAPEGSVEQSVYLLGHYAGQPSWFAAAIEAWPLHGTGLSIQLSDVDLAWAFEP